MKGTDARASEMTDGEIKLRDRLASLIPLLIAPIYVSVSFAPVITEISLVSPLAFATIAFFLLVLKRKLRPVRTGDLEAGV